MRIRKIATWLAAAGLALMLVGAGLAATFTDHAGASQTITVGTMDVSLNSDTPGAVVSDGGNTLTCPAILVTDSEPAWDIVGCHIQITSSGSISPDRVDLSVGVWTNGADLSKFMAQFNEGAGSWAPHLYGDTPMLSTLTGSVISSTSVVPADVYTYLGWLELGNGEMGKTVVVTYSIDAVA
jgi:hypothetical protein